MPTLLEIHSSPMATSVSRELTQEFVARWKAAHPAGRVLTRDLAATPPQPIDQGFVFAGFTPEHARQPEQQAMLAYSDECLAELNAAEEWVIGVAMHNFSIPSVLKLWIDQVVRIEKTFTYGANGPRGLLAGKKVTVLVAAGATYDQGSPYAAMNFVEPYLRTILEFMGVTDLTFVTAGGTAQLRSPAADREQFLAPHLEAVRRIAV